MKKGTVSGQDGTTTILAATPAQALTLQLTSAQLFIGAGGKFTAGVIDTSEAIGFSASTGLSLAVLTVGTTKYTGLELTQLSASLVGITGLDASLTQTTVQVNRVTPPAATKLNWGAFVSDPESLLLPSFTASMNSSVDLTASGQVALNVFGFVLATGGFVLKKGTVSGQDGTTTILAATPAQALTLRLTSAQLFIGAGGKFTAGVIDTSEAIGFSASTGLSLAVLTVGTTKYTGLELTQLSASLVGITGLDASLTQTTVQVNRVTPPAATKLNWGAFVSDPGTLLLPSFTASMNSSVDLTASGQVALNVFGFVLATGGFVLKKGTVSGQDGTTTILAATPARALTLQLTSAQLFIGAGGKFTAGVIDTSEAIGFSASTGLSLAVLTVGTTKYTGLELTQLSASLVGITGLDASLTQTTVQVNRVTPPAATKLNWGAFVSDAGTAAAAQLHGQHEQLR